MTTDLLQQVRVLDPVSQTDQVSDVLIGDGVIQAVAAAIADVPSDTTVHHCQGMVLGPGLVDLYSHSGEPGFEERETLLSLLQAGAAGGFTRLAVLPNTLPAMDNPASITWLRERITALKANGVTDSIPTLYPWGALTVAVKGQQMTELAELATTDVVGFADGQPISNLLLVQRLLEYLRSLTKPVALWACDPHLAGNGVMREGQESIRFGLPGIPAIAEAAALAAILECVEATGTPVHLMRIATARGVDLIRNAKSRGLPVTASTTWMHLLLHSEAMGSYDPHLKLIAPIGNPSDQEALLQACREGTIDAIAIDHTPYTYEEKTVAFAEAPAGAIGLELALPLLWQALVTSNTWSALDLWACLSTRPAVCLQQTPTAIAPGQPTELTLFDPNAAWVVDPTSLRSRSSNTPWLGQTITGKVKRIWCH